jgi:phosphocarrier protein HPr
MHMSQDESTARVTGCTVLTHEGGFHARPSIMLTQLAKRFSADVWIGLSNSGPWIDAKSIVRVMGLKAPRDATVHFAAEGTDAVDAINALVALVQSDFTPSRDS